MRQDRELILPLDGMNRETDINRLQEKEFIFALNSDDNEGVKHNEPSNYLNVEFPEGYRVIGQEKNLLKGETYYFLTNPETGKSSIGYVVDGNTFHNNEDIPTDCSDCLGTDVTTQPLEKTIQTPENTYIELINDNCTVEDYDLNFKITKPIKFIVIKNEASGTKIYWEDDLNQPRYINRDDVDYLYRKDIPCSEPEQTCLQIDKLLQFPKHTPIELQPETMVIGGNLRMGTYEYYACYCDSEGNEATDYSTGTNILRIFDQNNKVLDSSTLDSKTNYSIQISVSNIDSESYKYFKLVCVERGVLDSNEIAYEIGVYPITTDTVTHTSSGRLYGNAQEREVNITPYKIISTSALTRRTPKVEHAEGEAIIADRKYIFGVTRKEEVNIQPVVNVMSSLLKWQTVMTTEELYKDGVIASKFGGYMRDEVQPYALRLLYRDGGKSQNFVMINRPPTSSDLEDVSNMDYLKYFEDSCKSQNRTKRWQYFNTARVDKECDMITEYREVNQEESRSCQIENAGNISANKIRIETDGYYQDLQTYIEENKENLPPELKFPDLTGIHCSPVFGIINTTGELVEGKNYIIREVNSGDDFSNVGFQQIGEMFTATGTTPNSWENGTEVEETNCGTPQIDVENPYEIVVGEVEGETSKPIEADFPEGYDKYPSAECQYIHVRRADNPSEYEKDEPFRIGFNHPEEHVDLYVYKRDYGFTNEGCASADPIPDITNATGGSSVQRYFFNYRGENTLPEIVTNKLAQTGKLFPNENSIISTQNIARTSLWFQGTVPENGKFVLDITSNNNLKPADRLTGDVKQSGFTIGKMNNNQLVRVSLFNRCSDNEARFSHVFSMKTESIQWLIEKTQNNIRIDTGVDGIFDIAVPTPFPNNNYYVVVEPAVIATAGKVEDPDAPNGYDGEVVEKVRTAPPEGCFAVTQREIQIDYVDVSWDNITLNKIENYVTSCTYNIPIGVECEPIPYQQGEFAYNESINTYPDNKDLYDSGGLKITPEDFNDVPHEYKQLFEKYYVHSINSNNNYIYKTDELGSLVDFRCRKIRHYRFPDNRISPFSVNYTMPNHADTFIFPMGVHLDARLVKVMLNIALKNKLLTQEQYDNVYGFELLRGDNTVSKSVIANGLAFDMYKYQRNSKEYLYANYPYNDLGKDLFHVTTNKGKQNIPHPFNSNGNNRFFIIAPDILKNRTVQPTEITLSGYFNGSSTSTFTELDEHPKWTILGKRARTFATTLGIAESVLEGVIATGQALSNQWFTVGVSSGASLGAIASGIIAAGHALQAFSNAGKYRYDWLQAFRNLGTMYNFAQYGYSHGKYNNLLLNFDNSNYIKPVTVSKYIESGDHSMIDQVNGETYNINHFTREDGLFISTGEDFIAYSNTYKSKDNSDIKRQSSGAVPSIMGCDKANNYESEISSPYITLKNYIPNQFGDIDSITWITTNKQFKVGKNNSCEPIFGGNVSISRFTYRRKMPFFRKSAFGQPPRTPFEYSTNFNVGYPRYWCDYETDTQTDVLGFPFPDLDSEYEFDCGTSSSRFYVRPSKFYTYYQNIVDFLVESEVNYNHRYGGEELKDKFYPLESDIERLTQQKNLSLNEREEIKLSTVFTLPTRPDGSQNFKSNYNREFYKKISRNNNETIWSEEDNNEYQRLFDPYLVYKPSNAYSFKTNYGNLKSLKESVRNQAIARFTNSMVVFNTVDLLADRLTPQTQELGTGGIFATKPLEFSRSSLGFTGTNHYNIIDTEFGDVHIDSDKGQVTMLSKAGNSIDDLTFMYGERRVNMQKWFKQNLPFKIKRTVKNADIDNPYLGVGMTGGYDATRKRLFLTKRDYIVKNECVEYDDTGFVFNTTKCGGSPIEVCPEGYTYDLETNKCTKIVQVQPCPIGYYLQGGVCIKDVEVVEEDCPVDLVFTIDNSGSVLPAELQQQKDAVISMISIIAPKITAGIHQVGVVVFASTANIETYLTTDVGALINTINSIPTTTGGTHTVDALCKSKEVLESVGAREGVKKRIIFVTDGIVSTHSLTCFPRTGSFYTHDDVLDLGAEIKNEGVGITMMVLGSCSERCNVNRWYGGFVGIGGDGCCDIGTGTIVCNYDCSLPYTGGNPNYPLSSPGSGLGGYSTYSASFEGASSIVQDVLTDLCSEQEQIPIDCGECEYNEELKVCECQQEEDVTLEDEKIQISVGDKEYFKDASWTVSFKFELGKWNSYFSFKPNFYVSHQDYFQTGYNSTHSKLWSHTLEDSSFQVFQGELEPFVVEVNTANKFVSKILSHLRIKTEAIRYQNMWDSSVWADKGFNKLTIYNNTNNSGVLRLKPQKSLKELTQYPKKNEDNTQTILFSSKDGSHIINTIYNRVRQEDRNIPQWIWDDNKIDKYVNGRVVSFKHTKKLLERLRGDNFIIRLENDEESRFKILLKDIITESIEYDA